MSLSIEDDTVLNPTTWPGLARLVAAAFVFWALAAGVLRVTAPGLDTFDRLLVFTECVGMVFTACVVLMSRSRRLARSRPAVRWLLTGIVAAPVGYLVGHVLAFAILKEPMDHLAARGSDYMVPIVFELLIAAFVIHFAATRERIGKEALERSQATQLAAEAELRLLRAQLEPHMLFNTLANLRSLVKDDADQAELMIDQLIVYLRSALAASRAESTTLRGEFSQLRAYLDIMSLRMGPRLTYRLELPAALEQTAIPPMLLQPLVENAIKHGLEPKIGSGSVEVVARAVEAGIEIAVSDSGLGLTLQDESACNCDRGSGYGLRNVRDRLRNAYGPRASLNLQARTPNGVSAIVRIPS
jgi:hypothetical protein